MECLHKANMPVTLDKVDLPAKPGVYLFRNSEERVLYVGKATVLSQRIRSYFATNPDRAMIPELVRNSDDIANAIEIYKRTKKKSLASISLMIEHPYECIGFDERKNSWSYLKEPNEKKKRRQDYYDHFYFIR